MYKIIKSKYTKGIFCIFFLVNSYAFASSSKNKVKNKEHIVVKTGKSKIGSPYSYGSMGPNSFDCSGFVGYTYKNAVGLQLPRTAKDQSKVGSTVKRSNLKEGDLVFFRTAGKRYINHVGIYIGDGNFIHASSSKHNKNRVTVSPLDKGYYHKTFASARRVISN